MNKNEIRVKTSAATITSNNNDKGRKKYQVAYLGSQTKQKGMMKRNALETKDGSQARTKKKQNERIIQFQISEGERTPPKLQNR